MVTGFTIKLLHIVINLIFVVYVLVPFSMGCSSRYTPRASQMSNSNLRQARQNQEMTKSGCMANQFACKSGNQCINREFVCNGKYECDDESDELNFSCPHYSKCPKGMFRCKYGGCIMASLLCNKVKDCIDRSDEDPHICSSVKLTSSSITISPITSQKLSKIPTISIGVTSSMSTVLKSTRKLPQIKNNKDSLFTSTSEVVSLSQSITGTTFTVITTSTTRTTEYNKCELPEVEPHLNYIIYNSLNEPVIENRTVPLYSSILLKCNNESAFNVSSDGFSDNKQFYSNCTEGGIWNPPIRNCLKICEPFNYPQMATLKCIFAGFVVNCSGILVAGTQVISQCSDFLQKWNSNSSISCLENGEWDSIIKNCPSISNPEDSFGNNIISSDAIVQVQNRTTLSPELSEKSDEENSLLIAGYPIVQSTENNKVLYIWVGLFVVLIVVVTQVFCTVFIISIMIARLRARYNFS